MFNPKLDEAMKRYDRGRVLDSLNALSDQIASAWRAVQKVRVPKEYRRVSSIVVSGMGGSGWPAKIVYAVFKNKIRVPFTVVNGYQLPASVNRNTLCLFASYSGTTEEVLSALRQVKQKGAKLMILASGGPLARLARQWRIPAFIFEPKENPSKQPRLGTGYMAFGTLGLLARAGLIRIGNQEVFDLAATLRRRRSSLSHQAEALSRRLETRWPFIIAAEHLEANTEALRNQLHENAKHFAVSFPLPDLNHHLLEGLGHPQAVKSGIGLFIDSKFYSSRLRRRLQLTRQVFEKQRIPTVVFNPAGRDLLNDSMITLAFGGYLSFWLAMRHRLDPCPIPWVDFFKAKLKK